MLRNFIDSLFNPILQILDSMQAHLSNVSAVAARGYNLNAYFGWISILGPGFKAFLFSVIASVIFLTVLYMIKTNSRLIIWFKELIGRWM